MASKLGEVLKLLFTVYSVRATDDEKRTLAKAYQAALSDMSDQDLEDAAQEYIKTGKWFPKPSELREALEAVQARRRYEYTPRKRTDVEQLWHETKRTSPTLFEIMDITDPAELRAIADRLEADGREHAAVHLRWRADGFEAVAEVDRETVAVP